MTTATAHQQDLKTILSQISNGEILQGLKNGTLKAQPILTDALAVEVLKRLSQSFADQVGEIKDPEYILAKVRNVTEWLCEKSASKPHLLIFGNAGSGKSTMAKALQSVLYSTRHGGKTRAISAKSIGDIYRKREESESWQRINTDLTTILFIDDFGMEEDVVTQYGNKAQPMAMLIHNRYERGLHTIITTNLTAEEMAKKYDDRIMDRINGFARLSYSHISFRR